MHNGEGAGGWGEGGKCGVADLSAGIDQSGCDENDEKIGRYEELGGPSAGRGWER